MLENNIIDDSKSIPEILVSVLVPVYGVEKYIEKCAHSLFNQTYKNIEFIFVDDCSKDKSIELLKNVIKLYPQRSNNIKIIKHLSNQGLGGSRITAFNASSGEYIQIVDSDDYIELNMIELLVNEAKKESADIIFSSFYKTYEDGDEQISQFNYSNKKIDLVNKSFSQSALWNKMFKRNLLIENGITFYKDISYGEDLVISPKIIYCAKVFAFVNKPLYHYLIRNEGSYTFNFTEKHIEQTLHVVEELDSFFNNKPDNKSYLNSINTLKAIRKAKILRSGFIEPNYLNLYPELNNSIFKIDTNVKTKLILLLAKYKFKKLLKWITSRNNNN